MKIQFYEIVDIYNTLGISFNKTCLKNYYQNNYYDEYNNFKSFLSELINQKIIIEKYTNEYELDYAEISTGSDMPQKCKKIYISFCNNFTYYDCIRMFDSGYNFLNSCIKVKNDKFYYKKNSKWIKSNRHRTYFEFKNILKDQILKYTNKEFELINSLLERDIFYVDKEYMCEGSLDGFIYFDEKLIFLEER